MQTQLPNFTDRALPFLRGESEIMQLIKEKDWTATALGPLENWPISLRTTLGIVLNAGFPMLLFWGKDLNCIYNDAFRPSLGATGKHPDALGKPGNEVWAEIWDTIYPWLQTVLSGGEAVFKENMLVPFYRNGRMEDIYWTFSYSPAYDDDGSINGVVVTCVETTKQIEEQYRIANRLSEEELGGARFRKMIEQAPVSIAVFTGKDLVCTIANDAYLPLVAQSRKDFVGRPLFESLPETKEILDPIIREVMRTGQAYRAEAFEIILNRNNVAEQCWFDLIYEPLTDANGESEGFMAVAHEVTNQVLARRASEKHRQQLEAVVNSAPFPIGVYVGEDLIIELANQTMLDTYGKGNGVIGKSYKEILPELQSSGIFEQLLGVLNTGIPFHANNQRVDLVMHGEMQEFYFKYSFTPLFDAGGNVYGVMNTAANVTDLVLAQREARESNQKKDEFLSIASHELKTPLTNIKLNEQILLRQLSDPAQRNYLEKSQTQIRKLERLIADLLDVSKINSGHLQYHFDRTDLREVIASATESIRNEYNRENLEIFSADQPIMIIGDKVRLEQVVFNLISNACKYSQADKPVRITLQADEFHAIIRIADEGVGIGQTDQTKIFERFYRVGESGKSNVSGLGLGLFITSEIVAAHGGRIELESKPAMGSTFSVFLPLAES